MWILPIYQIKKKNQLRAEQSNKIYSIPKNLSRGALISENPTVPFGPNHPKDSQHTRKSSYNLKKCTSEEMKTSPMLHNSWDALVCGTGTGTGRYGGGTLSWNAISGGDSIRNMHSGHFQYIYVNNIIEP